MHHVLSRLCEAFDDPASPHGWHDSGNDRHYVDASEGFGRVFSPAEADELRELVEGEVLVSAPVEEPGHGTGIPTHTELVFKATTERWQGVCGGRPASSPPPAAQPARATPPAPGAGASPPTTNAPPLAGATSPASPPTTNVPSPASPVGPLTPTLAASSALPESTAPPAPAPALASALSESTAPPAAQMDAKPSASPPADAPPLERTPGARADPPAATSPRGTPAPAPPVAASPRDTVPPPVQAAPAPLDEHIVADMEKWLIQTDRINGTQKPKLAGIEDQWLYKSGDNKYWYWNLCMGSRAYTPDEVARMTTGIASWVSPLEAVQMLAAGDMPVSLVLPPTRGTPPDRCGPLAELVEFYVNTWTWLRDQPKRQRVHRVRVIIDDIAPEPAGPGVTIMVSGNRVNPNNFHRVGFTPAGAVGVAQLFVACGVSPHDVPTHTIRRPRQAETGHSDATDSILVRVLGYDRQYVLRDNDGKFRGFWLWKGSGHRCRLGDPGLLELPTYDDLWLLAKSIWARQHGAADTKAIKVQTFNGKYEFEPGPQPFVYFATAADEDPAALSLSAPKAGWLGRLVRAKQPAPDVPDGKTMVLHGEEAAVYASLWAPDKDP